ncbi:MAG: efflux transporter outer membrane subunit [Rhodospirillales bacterium]|nr:efflux transporter outer membrane subunit [Rhodospirillales bacterium]
MSMRLRIPAALTTLATLCACAVGPDYQRPPASVPASFKELDGWKPAEPVDATPRGAWWTVFDDPLLDSFVGRVNVSNQTLAASEAAFRQARAVVQQARAGLYPSISLDTSVTRSKSGTSRSNSGSTGFSSGGSSGAQTSYQPSLAATWDLDVWGKIRRTIESDEADAQASAADLAAATLSAQAELVSDYYLLRAADEQIRIFDEAAAAYERSLAITESQYHWGIATRADVALAQTQLESTRAQAIGAGVQRAQYEHAIAILMGVPPAELSISPDHLPEVPPAYPVTVPSALLERRPDIAAAERRMAAANAQIGLAEAAYYPDISLTASFGYASTALRTLLGSSNELWSAGLTATQLLFDAGSRSAVVEQARAGWDAALANYRQTTLQSFQQVEDQLAALRILDQQAVAQAHAVTAARDAERIELNQYKAGTVDYTSVVTAQQTALSNEQTALDIRSSRFTATVSLIQALGGGWSAQALPEQIGSVWPRAY